MSKRVTQKQLAANRENAKKSTGPKTAAGRAISKMNALKHGILSREVLVRGRILQESGRALAELHRRFWEDWQPVGATEEMLLDQMVTAHWRLRRALTAESGEIALSVDEGQWNRSCGPHPSLQWMQWEVFGDPMPKMQESSLGNGVLHGWLREVRAAVEREGELTETAMKIPFHGKPNRLSAGLETLRLSLPPSCDGALDAVRREENKNQVLTYIDRELRMLEWRKASCLERETAAEAARQAAAVLPAPNVLEKISRYETKLERQLYRAMAQLGRLQRIRRGELVPAPLTVELSERD